MRNFILRDFDFYNKCVCNKELKEQDKIQSIKIFKDNNGIWLYDDGMYLHQDCFNKYWMMSKIFFGQKDMDKHFGLELENMDL